MSFFDWFKKKKNKIEVPKENIQPVELTDPSAIHQYVIRLCEQMIEISHEMDDVRKEYEHVTAYLNDITVVEGLEGPEKDLLVDVATSVSKLTKARNDYLNAEHKITDETFNQMDELEAEVPAIIQRLKSNEVYLDAIQRDLNKLSAEKISWSMLRIERKEELKRLKGLSKMLFIVFGAVAVGVTYLSFTLEWDLLPIMITALLATVFGAYIVLRMQECHKDIHKCDINQNHAIALENRVKIKYVNTKNAVDYTCDRFHVNNSMELTYNYEQYMEACKERERFKQTNEDLEYFNGRLVRILQGLRLYDAKIWLSYANAIVEPREMVEVKHDLFSRRQKLRNRIEYNLDAIEDMKVEVSKYLDKTGNKKEQIETILQKVDEINKGIL